MTEVFYGSGPQGRLLSKVHDFLQAESAIGAIQLNSTNFVPKWQADPEIFGAPMGLSDVAFVRTDQGLRLQVVSLVLDEGDTILTLETPKAVEEEPATVDPFVEYFTDNFVPRLIAHPHGRCVKEAMRVQKLQEDRSHRIVRLRAAKTGQVIAK